MDNSMYNKSNFIVVMIGIVLIIILSYNNLSINNELQYLQNNFNELQYKLDNLELEINTLKKLNEIVYDSKYNVKPQDYNGEIVGKVNIDLKSNKLGEYVDLKLLYRETYDCHKEETYDYTQIKWETTEISSDTTNYHTELFLPYSKNYELKLELKDADSKIIYEDLPDLDLYTKLDYSFMKDINIYSYHNDILKFDAQISKLSKSYEDNKLENASCNIYHLGEVIKTFDILEANEISGRKEPKVQLEHTDGEYWFIIEEVDLSEFNILNMSDVEIELVLKDSLKNIYKESILLSDDH